MAKRGHKSFDRILKENLEQLLLPVSEKLLGVKIVTAKVLPEKLQVTLEREPDFLRLVNTEKQEQFILHLEFQTNNDSEMAYRMAEYKAILQRKYRKAVRQFVIYLGSQPAKMKEELPQEKWITGFELRSICEYDYRTFTHSDIPQEVILAILADPAGAKPVEVVKEILQRLNAVSKNVGELKKVIRQLNVLSRLRKLEDIVHQKSSAMPISVDVSEDYFFHMGIEQGIEQGKRRILLQIWRSGHLSVSELAEIFKMSEEQVEEILEFARKEEIEKGNKPPQVEDDGWYTIEEDEEDQ